ncbi:MAG: radical SAM protein [Thermoplasmatales archaeon]|nr:MAG: radical SAM protein [Thermoplasmatales archaeon]
MSRNNIYTPSQVVWELTLQCNLKCIHCGSSAGNARPNELSPTEAVKLCKDLAEINSRQVCFMGGEPFLRKEWYRLGREVRDLGMELLVISNGFIVNEDIISKLVKLDPYGISVSLDGATPETHDHIRGVEGSFKKVMEFISLSRKADLPTAVITTVNKLNFKELPMIKKLLLGKHIAWQIQTASPEGRFPKKLLLSKEEFYSLGLFIASMQTKYSSKELPVIGAHCCGYYSRYIPHVGLSSNWRGCQAGISILSVKSHGDVIGCLATPDKYIEGNIRDKSIIEIWNNPKSFPYNRRFQTINLGDNCRDCKYGETCKGGCMGMSIALTGIPHNDPYCYHKIEQKFS